MHLLASIFIVKVGPTVPPAARIAGADIVHAVGRSSMSNHLGNWNDLRDCVIDVAGFKLREMNPTLHPDSFATCRGLSQPPPPPSHTPMAAWPDALGGGWGAGAWGPPRASSAPLPPPFLIS
jgi:hypothetical protein